jgi:hypothetical protein
MEEWENNRDVEWTFSDGQTGSINIRQTPQPTDFGLQAVAWGCFHLRRVELTSMHLLGSATLSVLQRLDLEELIITACFAWSPDREHMSAAWPALQGCWSRLRVLRLTEVDLREPTAATNLVNIATSSPLEQLELNWSLPTQECFDSALRGCCHTLKQLEMIGLLFDLEDGPLGPVAAIQSVASNCRLLQSLELSFLALYFHMDLTAQAFSSLASGCTALTVLTLEGMAPCVVQASAPMLARLRLESLRVGHMETDEHSAVLNVDCFWADTLCEGSAMARTIERISISCDIVSPASVQGVLCRCGKLKRLHIDGFPHKRSVGQVWPNGWRDEVLSEVVTDSGGLVTWSFY